jgi:hypothetical protein
MLLHDLIRVLDSIAECREEYTSENICKQRSDDIDTRGPVELVGATGVLQEILQRVRKLKSRWHWCVCLELLWSVDRLLQAGGLLLAGMAMPFEPTYLMSYQARDVHRPPFRVEHRSRHLADIGIEQCTELAEELQDYVQRILVREHCGG